MRAATPAQFRNTSIRCEGPDQIGSCSGSDPERVRSEAHAARALDDFHRPTAWQSHSISVHSTNGVSSQNHQPLVICANFERGLFKNAAHRRLTMTVSSLKIQNTVPFYGTTWDRCLDHERPRQRY